MEWQNDVKMFHRLLGVEMPDRPVEPDVETQILRLKLIKEELIETCEAIAEGDIVKVADGIVDSIYVLIGTALVYGIDLLPIWDEIHKSNMNKLGGPVREDGKILKPPGWQPPDVEGILTAQGWAG